VYIHPELGLRLAQAKIEEARSRVHGQSAPRAASLERRVSGVTVDTRKDRWAAARAEGRATGPADPVGQNRSAATRSQPGHLLRLRL